MDKLMIAILAGVGFAAFAAAALHAALRLKHTMPGEDRAFLDPLPGPLRLLWPSIRMVDYHLCTRIPHRLLEGPAQSLRLAGLGYLISPGQLVALGIVLTCAGAAVAALALALAGLFAWQGVAAGAALGHLLPRAWLKDALDKRRKAIVRALPAYLDYLTMSVEAGLNMAGAIGQAVAKGPAGPLKNEFALVLRDLRAGLTRTEALRRMDERVRIAQVSSFIGAVIHAERLGASLGPTLRAQAGQRRAERFQAAEKLAMEAPVKLIFPLVVFIFPVTFLVLMFPIAVKFMQSGVRF